MDKQRIGLIGVIFVAAIALAGGIYLTAKGIPTPAWLATMLTLIGSGFAWLVKPPGQADDKKDGAS